MLQQMITRTLKIENEDCYYMNDTLAFVIDGASGLDKTHITDAGSDAAWYSHNLKDAILKYQSDMDLKVVLQKAVQSVNEKFKKFPGYETVIDFPSAVISMSRINQDTLEILVLGDCTCILKKKNGEIKRIADRRIEQYDQRAIKEGIKRSIDNGVDFCETRKYYQHILTENRKMKNKKSGYYCLSDDEDAINYAYVKCYKCNEIHSVVLMSDGFSQMIDLFHLYDEQGFMSALSRNRVEKLYDELYSVQKTDNRMNDYPRFSLSDDATLVYFEL
ncbi:protein phosphatase 2C domain-containing protein [[Clostridium] innocuum]|nr:protein phosphatase 2C domain-containing protein [[Clostridium] innocuum]